VSLTISVKEIVSESGDPLLAIHPSWDRVPLADIATILNGFAFQSKFFSNEPGMPLLRIRDVSNNSTSCRYQGAYDTMYLVRPGDLIVGMDGDFTCAVWAGPVALLNQRVCKITLTTDLYDRRFLEFALPGYLEAINNKTSSQTVRHLSSRSLAEIPLPLPPLTEQKRIVAKIEELLAFVNSAREHVDRAPATLKRFRQAVLAAACSGKLTADWRERNAVDSIAAERLISYLRDQQRGALESSGTDIDNEWLEPSFEIRKRTELPKSWHYLALGNLGIWSAGGTPSKSKAAYWEDGTVPWLSPKDMKAERLKGTQDHITKFALSDAGLKLLPADSILFVVRGMILAHTFPVALNTRALTINQDIRAITPHSGILPEYLLRALQAESTSILFAVRESTHGTRRLESETLKRWPIPIPTPREQAEIARRLEALFKLAATIEKQIAAGVARISKLPQTILAKAFCGELVPTEADLARQEGCDYESAATLLERIRAIESDTSHNRADGDEFRELADTFKTGERREPRRPGAVRPISPAPRR
jgi:type I restriction enzyme S subunit